MLISSIVDRDDLREADRLSRYAWYLPLRVLHEKEIWFIGGSAVILTVTNLLGRTNELWHEIFLLYALAAGALLLRGLYTRFRLAHKVRRMNRTELAFEPAPRGLLMHLPEGPPRIMSWDKFLDARIGRRVLILYYVPSGQRFSTRKYLIVRITQLSRDELHGFLLLIPGRIRSKSIGRILRQWRLT